eukprot:EC714111.1.p1 GENE.EC714111.1~~EC714111.1.p1  ORF type:complete len:167 (+),score=32.29 EC714111.1:67-501(+)
MGDGHKILQIIFIVFKALIMLCGILIIAAGGAALSGVLSDIVPIGNFGAIAGIIVAVGVFILIIAVLGLVGGIRRINIILIIYFVLQTLLAVVLLGEAIGACVLRYLSGSVRLGRMGLCLLYERDGCSAHDSQAVDLLWRHEHQ